MPMSTNVPSTDIVDFKRDVEDTTRFVNQDSGTVTNRVGKTMRPLPVVSDAIEAQVDALNAEIVDVTENAAQAFGFRPVGLFADGFVVTYRNQTGIYDDGLGNPDSVSQWIYNGALPFTVPAETVPSEPNYTKVFYSDHAQLNNRNAAGAHNADAILTTDGGTVQNYIDKVPRVHDIHIIYGQSNSIGYAGQPGVPAIDNNTTPSPRSGCLHYDALDKLIKPMSNTMWHLNAFLEGNSRGNAWTAFGNEWIERTGRGVVIYSAGRGGASISQLRKGNTTPVPSDGAEFADYYQRMIDEYPTLLASIASAGLTVGNVYFHFHQGETDQLNVTNYVNYADNLKAIIADVFADLPISKFGLYIVGCPGSRELRTWQRIQAAQYNVIDTFSYTDYQDNVAVIFDGCPAFTLEGGQYNPADTTHYSQRGYNQMGHYAAQNLARWVSNDANLSGSQEDLSSRNSIHAFPFFRMQKVSAFARFDGSSWLLLRDTNTTKPDGKYPCFIESATATSDALRFKMSGRGQITFDQAVDLSENFKSQSIRAYIEKYNLTNEWGFDVKFLCDLSFFVDVTSGVIFNSYPPTIAASGSLERLCVSATSNGTIATLTHPAIKNSPQVSYYSNSATDTGSAGFRAQSSTSTTLSANGGNNVVAVRMFNVPLTMAQLVGAGIGEVSINTTVAD